MEVTNIEFCEAIWILRKEVTNQVRQKRGSRQEEVDTYRILEFYIINPPCFSGSSNIGNPSNFVEKLKNVFNVMHVINIERVDLEAYQIKDVIMIWFYKWKEAYISVHHIRVGLVLKRLS